MIRHIVLFHVHEGTTRARMQNAVDRLEALVGVIPGLISLEAGIDIGDGGSTANADFGLIAELEDRAALETFSNDGRHREVAMDILTFRDQGDIVILDFEH